MKKFVSNPAYSRLFFYCPIALIVSKIERERGWREVNYVGFNIMDRVIWKCVLIDNTKFQKCFISKMKSLITNQKPLLHIECLKVCALKYTQKRPCAMLLLLVLNLPQFYWYGISLNVFFHIHLYIVNV